MYCLLPCYALSSTLASSIIEILYVYLKFPTDSMLSSHVYSKDMHTVILVMISDILYMKGEHGYTVQLATKVF